LAIEELAIVSPPPESETRSEDEEDRTRQLEAVTFARVAVDPAEDMGHCES
jgi:hypothetical protein